MDINSLLSNQNYNILMAGIQQDDQIHADNEKQRQELLAEQPDQQ